MFPLIPTVLNRDSRTSLSESRLRTASRRGNIPRVGGFQGLGLGFWASRVLGFRGSGVLSRGLLPKERL